MFSLLECPHPNLSPPDPPRRTPLWRRWSKAVRANPPAGPSPITVVQGDDLMQGDSDEVSDRRGPKRTKDGLDKMTRGAATRHRLDPIQKRDHMIHFLDHYKKRPRARADFHHDTGVSPSQMTNWIKQKDTINQFAGKLEMQRVLGRKNGKLPRTLNRRHQKPDDRIAVIFP